MAHDIALFVYGSLKPGFQHANVLGGALFSGPALATPYALVRYGQYPAMVPAPEGVVHGELVFVDQVLLEALDDFEQCPSLYQRHTIQLVDGRDAQAYLVTLELAAACPRIAGGIWLETSD